VLAEGRYFRNPYSWGWEIHPITDIPAGKLGGVVTRLYGDDLAATLGEKKIVVHNALIRHVVVPDQILDPIQQASIAIEQNLTNKERQNTAKKERSRSLQRSAGLHVLGDGQEAQPGAQDQHSARR
jgi:hypothetical protein